MVALWRRFRAGKLQFVLLMFIYGRNNPEIPEAVSIKTAGDLINRNNLTSAENTEV